MQISTLISIASAATSASALFIQKNNNTDMLKFWTEGTPRIGVPKFDSSFFGKKLDYLVGPSKVPVSDIHNNSTSQKHGHPKNSSDIDGKHKPNEKGQKILEAVSSLKLHFDQEINEISKLVSQLEKE